MGWRTKRQLCELGFLVAGLWLAGSASRAGGEVRFLADQKGVHIPVEVAKSYTVGIDDTKGTFVYFAPASSVTWEEVPKANLDPRLRDITYKHFQTLLTNPYVLLKVERASKGGVRIKYFAKGDVNG